MAQVRYPKMIVHNQSHCSLLYPVIKTLERIRLSSNQNIGEGESNFDEKYVEEMFNWSEIHSEKKYYL